MATINTLYKQVTVPHSSIFSKFLSHVAEHPGLGTLVRRLDLSHFTSVGLGRSRQANSEIQNLTSKTLLQCLQLTPAIQEVLLQENLDDDIDADVLHHLFFDLPQLRAIDFCAASSFPFVNAFSSVLGRLRQSPNHGLGIKRLSLHECFTLPSQAFENLLPHLPHLTHLDVAHTRITDRALASIPESAQVSHLNLGRCMFISGEGLVEILISHPALKGLVYLNLACDIARYRLLWEADVSRLLPALPTTLRSLNLNGAQIHERHIPQLTPLTRHLEELGIAHADLSLADINALFSPYPPPARPQASGNTNEEVDDDDEDEDEDEDEDLEDSDDESDEEMDRDDGFCTPNQSSAQSSPSAQSLPPTLHYLDLTSIPAISQSSLFNTPPPHNILLSSATLPLEVLELGDKAITSLRECRNTNKRLGWCVKELGRRGWYVRDLSFPSSSPSLGPSSSSSAPPSPAAYPLDKQLTIPVSDSIGSISPQQAQGQGQQQQASGRRPWKMGAMWWGMRKCPVAWGEVGGLYGHYMFKK